MKEEEEEDKPPTRVLGVERAINVKVCLGNNGLCWIGITNPLNHIRPALRSRERKRKKKKKRHVSKLMNKNIKEAL